MSNSSISDRIGRIGERYFEDLADKAGLIIGRIEPDRLGKDRVIEFDLDNHNKGISFDTRPAPISCSIQIKTILSNNDRVRISLSVAERLVGDVRPTLIAIIRISDDYQVVDMHLVHIWGDNLAQILKRLRDVYAKGKTNLNKLSTSFRIKDGVPVDLKPSELKNTLADLVGNNMDIYAREKNNLRTTIGYNNRERIVGSISFSPCTIDDFVDGMLGLKNLEVKQFQPSEVRFGIKLPMYPDIFEGINSGIWRLDPTPVEDFYLEAENPISHETIQIPCGVVTPAAPRIPRENYKILVTTNMFQITIGMTEFKPKPFKKFNENTTCPLAEWHQTLIFWKLLNQEKTEISVKNTDGSRLIWGETSSSSASTIKNLKYQISLIEILKDICHEAGVKDQLVSIAELLKLRKDIQEIHALFFQTDLEGEFSFQSTEILSYNIDSLSFIYVSALEIGNKFYAYGLRLEMNGTNTNDGASWTSSSFKPLEITTISNSEELQSFTDRLAKISGINNQIIYYSPSDDS